MKSLIETPLHPHPPVATIAHERTMEDHYRSLLAPIYPWMIGNLASALERSRAELRSLGVGHPALSGRAVDLGAGLGLQSIPLAELGYQVLAIDASEDLLARLETTRGDIQTVCADFVLAPKWTAEPCELVVCMGDTLTHLRWREEVVTVFRRASTSLARGGKLILTFRDYAAAPARNPSCFLVRSDADRIMTVCLDYREDRVRVTDIVHEAHDQGWLVRASSYEKLRLPADWVSRTLRDHAFRVDEAKSESGWVSIVASRS